MNILTRTLFDAPDLVRNSEYETDLSDTWAEECDPAAETGAVCTGYFSRDDDEMTLLGIKVHEDALGTTYHDRADAVLMWSFETVCRVEDMATAERITDQYDAQYDWEGDHRLDVTDLL